jgi:hypothetical protein
MVVCSATLHAFEVKKMADRLMHFPTWVDLKVSNGTLFVSVADPDPNQDPDPSNPYVFLGLLHRDMDPDPAPDPDPFITKHK